uniref:RING-type domain-containing protein n=1 Tax=Parastrongyloides trichosuri TaxID=131310 RepID=A0A0N4ZHF3_PARTI
MIQYDWLAGFAIYFLARYPPPAFIGSGLTLDNLVLLFFKDNNATSFIAKNIHRAKVTFISHTIIAAGYFSFMTYKSYMNFDSSNLIMIIQTIITILAAFYTTFMFYTKVKKNNNPDDIILQLSKYASNERELKEIISEIDLNYYNNVPVVYGEVEHSKVVIIGNWLFKMELYGAKVVKLDDTELILKESLNRFNRGRIMETLYRIQLRGVEYKYDPFEIILSFTVLEELNTRVRTSIDKLLIEKHNIITAKFKERISGNPKYYISQDEEIENCLGCLQNKSNVIIRKRCGDVGEEGGVLPCEECNCRSLWCVRCLALIYESKCGKNISDGMLPIFCKASCPTCRARFCILDVQMIEVSNENTG